MWEQEKKIMKKTRTVTNFNSVCESHKLQIQEDIEKGEVAQNVSQDMSNK